jgi:hypothetical protein
VDARELAGTSVAASPVATEVPGLSVSIQTLEGGPAAGPSIFDPCSLDLPPDLAAGEYRVVDQSGHVEVLIFSEDDLVYYGLPLDSPPRDLYTVIDGVRRVYFIRIDNRAFANLPVTTTASTAAQPLWWRPMLRNGAAFAARWQESLHHALTTRWRRVSTSVRTFTEDVLFSLRSMFPARDMPERISNSEHAHGTEL